MYSESECKLISLRKNTPNSENRIINVGGNGLMFNNNTKKKIREKFKKNPIILSL
jgi:hypothetical protein